MYEIGATPKSSSFKGVAWNTKKRKWETRRTVDGKRVRIGYSANEAEAARKFDEHVRNNPGKYASGNEVNFPQAPNEKVHLLFFLFLTFGSC